MTPRRLIEPARLAGTAVLRTQSDERLVDLVREGNDRAFEAIVHRYRRALLRYCGQYLSATRAEDAVQQTFVNALNAIRGGSAAINLRPWLYRIAHNASLNVLRQAGADHDQISDQIDGVETPPQALERGERFRSVVSAVHDLPERQRDAIVLQALEGRSYEEIARELGVSGGAVRQLLNRARTTLRQTATAFTPPAFLARLGGAIDAPVAERVAQVVAGAGGGAVLAKGVAALAVAGAVIGGTVERVLPGLNRAPRDAHSASKAGGAGATAAAPALATAGGGRAALSSGGHVTLVDIRRPAASTEPPGSGARPGAGGERHGGGSAGGTGNTAPRGQQLSDHGGDGGGSPGSGDGSHSGDGHSGSGGDDHSSSGHGSGGHDSSGGGSGSVVPVAPSHDGSGDGSSPLPPATPPATAPSGKDGSGSRGSGKSSDDTPEPPDPSN